MSSGIQRQRSMLTTIFCVLGLGAGLALGAGLEQGLMQALELLVLRMERAKIGIGRFGFGDFGQHRLRIAQSRRDAEQLVELGGLGPSAAGVARIFQDGEIKLDLVRRGVVGRFRQVASRRQLEGRARQAPIVGSQHLVDRRERASRRIPCRSSRALRRGCCRRLRAPQGRRTMRSCGVRRAWRGCWRRRASPQAAEQSPRAACAAWPDPVRTWLGAAGAVSDGSASGQRCVGIDPLGAPAAGARRVFGSRRPREQRRQSNG